MRNAAHITFLAFLLLCGCGAGNPHARAFKNGVPRDMLDEHAMGQRLTAWNALVRDGHICYGLPERHVAKLLGTPETALRARTEDGPAEQWYYRVTDLVMLIFLKGRLADVIGYVEEGGTFDKNVSFPPMPE
jgi:hypothetical protein